MIPVSVANANIMGGVWMLTVTMPRRWCPQNWNIQKWGSSRKWCVRHAGAFVNSSCGMHVHVDAANHTPRSLKNALTIMYCKEDILFKALNVQTRREDEYCQKVRPMVLEKIRRMPNSTITMEKFKRAWYEGNDGSSEHYNWTKTEIGDNPAFTFRTFLLRLGLIGDEYKNVRKHLLANLDGDKAWRYDKSTYACLQNPRRTDDAR